MSAMIWVLLAIVNVVHSRDVIVGSNDIGRKIFDETKQAGPAIWRQMQNLTITTNDTEVISKIVITDLRAEKDGDARIVEGGEGQRNVTIELKSPTVLRGYEFHIEAYAVAEDQLKTMAQSSESPQHNMPKDQKGAATSNAGVNTFVGSDKELIRVSTTTASTTNEGNINRRQNRDTENKDKSTQVINSTIPSLSNIPSTSEISKLPLPYAPTSTTENTDQKFPIVNREFQQGYTFDHPRVNIYEVNKLPESTARAIPSTNVKSEDRTHPKGPLTSGESNKNGDINVNTDKMHAHISYPRSGNDSLKQSQEPVDNNASPIVEEDKNKNVRHRRDLANPIEAKEVAQKHFGVENKADTTEMTTLNSQGQERDEEHAKKPETVLCHVASYAGSLENQHGQDVAEKSKPSQHIVFRDRHLHKSFGNAAASQNSLNPSSTPLPKGRINDESTETVGKFEHSQTSQLGKQSSSSTNIPDATEMSRSTTENLAKPALEPIVTDAANTERPHVFNARKTRDTTSVNNKILSESILPPVLRSSSATLKPEVDTKNAKPDVNTTDSQTIIENSKVPVAKSNNEGISKGTVTDSPQSEEKDRNARGVINTNDKKVKETVSNDEKDTLGSPKKITLNEATTSTQESDKVPTEPKSEDTEKSPKAKGTEIKNGDDKERQTRDTSSVDESKDKKEASTEKPDDAVIKTKMEHETKHKNDESLHSDNKSAPSSIVNDKVAKSNDKNILPRILIPVWNKEDQEEERKANDSEHNNEKDDQQSPKFPREAKESVESKSRDEGNKSDILLTTHLNIKSTEKPISIKPITEDNKEKVLKKPNDDISKH